MLGISSTKYEVNLGGISVAWAAVKTLSSLWLDVVSYEKKIVTAGGKRSHVGEACRDE